MSGFKIQNMARDAKHGLLFFPLDTTFFSDIKIRKLIKMCGSDSVAIYVYLLCLIYKEGYYITYDPDFPFLISESTGLQESYIEGVIECFFDIKLFHVGMFEKHGILTSKGIQNRYKNIQDSFRKKAKIEKYKIDSCEETDDKCTSNPINVHLSTINVQELPINVHLLHERKGKEKKGKEKEGKERGKTPPPPPKKTEQKQIFFEENPRPTAEDLGGISPAEMFLPGPVEKISEMYKQENFFIEARDRLMKNLSIQDQKIFFEWVDNFSNNLIEKGMLKKTLNDFAQHFANWIKFQDVEGGPKTKKNGKQNSKNENGNSGNAERFYKLVGGGGSGGG